MNPLFIAVDGNSLLHRAFHAIGPLTDSQGNPTNAIYGFMGMLLKVLGEKHPTHVAIAFDRHGPTFRHKVYEPYKGTRKPTDPALIPQFQQVRDLLTELGIAILQAEGFEADDILGTLAQRCQQAGMPALLVTGDRDALQLVTDTVHVLYTKRGISDTVEFDPATVKATYGITPDQVPDLKGLMGDASDNIPGVPGVGEKTALKLLDAYGTLAAVLDHAQAQKGKLKERLLEHRALAETSLWLATIKRDAPIEGDLSAYALNLSGGRAAFEALGFRSLLPRLEKLLPQDGGKDTEEPSLKEDSLSAIPQVPYAALLDAPQVALCWDGDITLCGEKGWAKIPICQDLLSEGMSPEDAFGALKPLFIRPQCLKVFGAKALLHALSAMGHAYDGACIREDALLAGWLLNPLGPPKALSELITPADARGLWRLCGQQEAALQEKGMLALYRDMEIPLMGVLLSMEREGFLVDRRELERLGALLTHQETTLREEIIQETGGFPFNLNSPKQLGEVLFERLGLPKGRKTKSGYSTDAETLEGLRHLHPAVDKLLTYRQVTKLNATYIQGLTAQIERDGRVRSSFDQTATVTGRLSSNEPNLQNIPVRTELGREIRRAFMARPGWVLVDADYSQIELRILAHLSGDPGMVAAFHSGEDIHTRTAAEVYGVPAGEVTGAMRSAAKAVNFGIVYGISDFGLARNISVSRREAGDFIARYFEKYPGVKDFMEKAVAEGKALGYATTLLGRRRPLPELASSQYNTRSFGERAAMNTPVQGAAADIIKLAMVAVHRALLEKGLAARLILQVHDELIVECPQAERDTVAALLAACMEGVIALSVPLVADVKWGGTWYEAK